MFDTKSDFALNKLDWNAVSPSLDALCPEDERNRHRQGGGHLESECIQVHQRALKNISAFFPEGGENR